MTTVTRIDGAPGTGKTYTLRQRLEDRKAAGLTAGGVKWITFTNAGTKDAVETVKDVFPGLDADDSRVKPEKVARTFHSLTLSLLFREDLIESDDDIEPDPVIAQGSYGPDDINPFAEFCETVGMEYDPNANDTKKLLSGEKERTPVGNKFFAVYDFLNQTCKPPEKHYDAPLTTPIPNSRIPGLIDDWEAFKRDHYDHRVYQFCDYVHLAYDHGETPDVDLLLIDEFQDFTPAEYRLYKSWRDSGRIDEIVLAGDPEQSIYSFRGGSPVYFEETDVDDDVTLKESYRCPSPVANAAVGILEANKHTDPRGFRGRDADGRLRTASVRDGVELADAVIDSHRAATADTDEPSVMLLTRTNSQLRTVSRALQTQGIPFDILGSRASLWQYGEMRAILEFLREFPTADSYDLERVWKVTSNLPDGRLNGSLRGDRGRDEVPADTVHNVFAGFDGVMGVIRQLDLADWKRDALKAAVDSPADITTDDVKIGTIHTAKGLEAPSVYLFAESSDRINEQYERDDDAAAEEHRVWYVGVTRASDELTIVDDFLNGPTAPPVKALRLSGVMA